MINIFYIPLIFLFLPAFTFMDELSPFIFIMPLFIFISFCFKPKYIKSSLIYLYNHSILKYAIFLYIWMIIASFFAALFGYYSFSRFIYIAIFSLIFRYLFVYLAPIFIFPKFITLKNFIKFMFIAFIFIYIIALIEFIGAKYNIEILNNIENFISRIRDYTVIEGRTSLPRIKSVFREPGYFGRFLTIHLPIVYELCLSKLKIFKNIFINLFIKRLFILLTWINIILVQSPLWLLIALGVTLFYFKGSLTNLLKKYKEQFLISLVFIFLFGIIISMSIDLSKTFMARAFSVLEIIPKLSLKTLIVADPSLATRIVSWINQILIFLKHPIFGVGVGNTGSYLINAFNTSGVPMTEEIESVIMLSNGKIGLCTNVLYTLLYQTGIIGFALYCVTMIKSIGILKKVKKYFYGLELCFINGFMKMLITLFVVSIIYEQFFLEEFLLFYLGLTCSIILIAKQRKKRMEINKNENMG